MQARAICQATTPERCTTASLRLMPHRWPNGIPVGVQMRRSHVRFAEPMMAEENDSQPAPPVTSPFETTPGSTNFGAPPAPTTDAPTAGGQSTTYHPHAAPQVAKSPNVEGRPVPPMPRSFNSPMPTRRNTSPVFDNSYNQQYGGPAPGGAGIDELRNSLVGPQQLSTSVGRRNMLSRRLLARLVSIGRGMTESLTTYAGPTGTGEILLNDFRLPLARSPELGCPNRATVA